MSKEKKSVEEQEKPKDAAEVLTQPSEDEIAEEDLEKVAGGDGGLPPLPGGGRIR